MNPLTLDELGHLYGSSTERRIELFERLKEWLKAARSTQALKRAWVFRSFVSDKPGPDDLDVVAVFAPQFDPSDLPAGFRHWFDHELCREIHEIDLFFSHREFDGSTTEYGSGYLSTGPLGARFDGGDFTMIQDSGVLL